MAHWLTETFIENLLKYLPSLIFAIEFAYGLVWTLMIAIIDRVSQEHLSLHISQCTSYIMTCHSKRSVLTCATAYFLIRLVHTLPYYHISKGILDFEEYVEDFICCDALDQYQYMNDIWVIYQVGQCHHSCTHNIKHYIIIIARQLCLWI